MSDIDVRCQVIVDGWSCQVRVSDEDGSSVYDVSIGEPGSLPPSVHPHPGPTDIEGLVRETFAFLLERESRTSILPRFDLNDVSRYFPEYPSEIGKRITS